MFNNLTTDKILNILKFIIRLVSEEEAVIGLFLNYFGAENIKELKFITVPPYGSTSYLNIVFSSSIYYVKHVVHVKLMAINNHFNPIFVVLLFTGWGILDCIYKFKYDT